jgi:hypothetical protein
VDVVQKLDITIAKLRLLLADVMAKEQQLALVRQQFRDQLRKAIDYSIYGDGSLDGTLGLMGEIQQRIAAADSDLRDLGLVRARAERELESLQLTKRIEAAKTELNDLLERQAELGRDAAPSGATPTPAPQAGPVGRELDQQIQRLRQQINEASEQAAKTLDRR